MYCLTPLLTAFLHAEASLVQLSFYAQPFMHFNSNYSVQLKSCEKLCSVTTRPSALISGVGQRSLKCVIVCQKLSLCSANWNGAEKFKRCHQHWENCPQKRLTQFPRALLSKETYLMRQRPLPAIRFHPAVVWIKTHALREALPRPRLLRTESPHHSAVRRPSETPVMTNDQFQK